MELVTCGIRAATYPHISTCFGEQGTTTALLMWKGEETCSGGHGGRNPWSPDSYFMLCPSWPVSDGVCSAACTLSLAASTPGLGRPQTTLKACGRPLLYPLPIKLCGISCALMGNCLGAVTRVYAHTHTHGRQLCAEYIHTKQLQKGPRANQGTAGTTPLELNDLQFPTSGVSAAPARFQ